MYFYFSPSIKKTCKHNYFNTLDILSLTPKLRQIKQNINENKQSDSIVVNNRTKNINDVSTQELLTSIPKCNGSIQGTNDFSRK